MSWDFDEAAWQGGRVVAEPAAAPACGHDEHGSGWQVPLASLVRMLSGDPDAPAASSRRVVAVHSVKSGGTLAHQGAPAAFAYVVIAGSFKGCLASEDGYEHVIRFIWSHDVIGLEAFGVGAYACSTVALEDSRVAALPLAELQAMRREVPSLDTALQASVGRVLAHAGDVAEVMAAVSADTRLARFLLQLSAQMDERGQSWRRLRLRMSRRDIASYLGLAHETISRSFGILSQRGCLRVHQREVEILDLATLRRFARPTRMNVDGDAEPGAAAPRARHAPCLAG